MIYIYDILLNFNDNLYEFYEWEKSDYIYHIKKIPIFKVSTEFMENLINKEIKLDDDFLNIIINKTEIFENRKIKNLKYSCLFTDGLKVVGVLINNNLQLSDLLLDEECDSINIANRCKLINISYNIIGDKFNNYFKTRKQIKIRNFLLKEINNIYENKDKIKLKYLYYEYFNKEKDDNNLIYQELIKSLDNINYNHEKLYELVKLCNSNLTI